MNHEALFYMAFSIIQSQKNKASFLKS